MGPIRHPPSSVAKNLPWVPGSEKGDAGCSRLDGRLHSAPGRRIRGVVLTAATNVGSGVDGSLAAASRLHADGADGVCGAAKELTGRFGLEGGVGVRVGTPCPLPDGRIKSMALTGRRTARSSGGEPVRDGGVGVRGGEGEFV